MPDSQPLAGKIVTHYRIIEMLGGGGMALSTKPKTPSSAVVWRSNSCG